MSCLHRYLVDSAQRYPHAIAVEDPGVAEISYQRLDRLSDLLRDRLFRLGVRRGDRVGMCLHKSIDSVAAIFGIQKAGAVHVPVDASAPAERNAFIFENCEVRALIGESDLVDGIRAHWSARMATTKILPIERSGHASHSLLPTEGTSNAQDSLLPTERASNTQRSFLPTERASNARDSLLPVAEVSHDDGSKSSFRDPANDSSIPLERLLETLQASDPAPRAANATPNSDDLAYILYTSGSTGRPKGVQISHRNAMCFIDWCSDRFSPREDDRFSSHAPFHFDLSVLDLYVPLKHGATLVLINEQIGKDPVTMAQLIAERHITSWYSAPSILSLLSQFGHLERFDFSALRFVHFAGEVFPIKHLRALEQQIPHPRYFNLYGPTETNVCNYFEIPAVIEEDRNDPYPIGKPCEHFRHRVVDPDGHDVSRGEEGELWIAGPGVMLGYWNLPERNAEVFREDAEGVKWYRTGDIVVEPPDGEIVFRGRRDRMVKKRGYRIELGEIEAALYRHPEIEEAAVIAVPDAEGGVAIRAFLACRGAKLSIIRLKQFCAENLISYMIPDIFTILDRLPKTSTDKTDYQKLKEIV